MTISWFQELERKANVTLSGTTVTRTFGIRPGNAVPEAIAQILGQIRSVNGRLFRTMPMNDPIFPQCFAKSVEVAGTGAFADRNNNKSANFFDTMAAVNNFAEATLVVTFESGTRTSDQMLSNDESQICTLDLDFSGKSLTLPNEYFNWVNSPTYNLQQSGINASYVIPESGAQIIRHYCVNRPMNAIYKLAGKVNNADFTVQDILFPKETLRFDTASIKQGTTWNNINYYEISYKFAVQGIWAPCATAAETLASDGSITIACTTSYGYVGWNRLYRPDRGYWDYVQTNVGGKKPYLPDSDVTQTVSIGTITGFEILFHPEAK